MRFAVLGLLVVALLGQPVRAGGDASTTLAIAAPPADVYAAVTDYRRWPYIFDSVKSVDVLYRRGPKAIVRVHAWSGDDQTLELDNDPQHHVLRIKGRGEPIEATVMFAPSADGSSTIATASVAASARGATRLFAGGWHVRHAPSELAAMRAYIEGADTRTACGAADRRELGC